MRVQQRPARVAGIDGRVGLDDVGNRVIAAYGSTALQGAPQGAHDAHGHGAPQFPRVANGNHALPHAQAARVAKLQGKEAFRVHVHLEHGQVAVLVAGDEYGRRHPAVGKGDAHLLGVHDDVVVGDNVPLFVNDKTRAAAKLDHFAVIVVGGHVDADHGRVGALVDIDQQLLFGVGFDDERLGEGSGERGLRGFLDNFFIGRNRGLGCLAVCRRQAASQAGTD